MGPQLQYLETVLTCTGNYYAPDLHNHVDDLKKKLQQLIADGKILMHWSEVFILPSRHC